MYPLRWVKWNSAPADPHIRTNMWKMSARDYDAGFPVWLNVAYRNRIYMCNISKPTL